MDVTNTRDAHIRNMDNNVRCVFAFVGGRLDPAKYELVAHITLNRSEEENKNIVFI